MSNVHHYDNAVESCGWPVTPLTVPPGLSDG